METQAIYVVKYRESGIQTLNLPMQMYVIYTKQFTALFKLFDIKLLKESHFFINI